MDAVEKETVSPTGQGRELGRYRLVAELARGGMGVVYLALVGGPGGFHKLFVVKELKAHLAEDPNLVFMFLEEACIAAKLNHANIVQTIEVGSDRGRHFIAMEYLDGQSYQRVLGRVRRAGTTLPLAGHLYITSRLLEGLQYAHAPDLDGKRISVVHRDMSPHNVFLTYDGQVKIIDFGIAKALESPNETRTGVLKGKVAYMAPEQAVGDPVDCRADIFSVGVMLWEAVVGRRMWSNEPNDARILHALVNGSVPRPRDAKPNVDPELERIIMKATAAEARQRYASAAEFQADIDSHLGWLGEPPFETREIAQFLRELFSQERASLQALLDDQLRAFRPGTPDARGTEELPLVGPPSHRSGTAPALSLSQAPAEGGETETHRAPVGAVGARETRESEIGPSSSGSRSSSRTTLGSSSGPSSGSASGAVVRAPRAPLAVAAAAGALAVVAGVAGVWGLLRHSTEQRAERTARESASAAAADPGGPVASAPAAVQVRVNATPRDARIRLDEGAAGGAPFASALPRDGKAHTIHIEAPGYQAKTLRFAADDDVTLDVSLVVLPLPVDEGAPRVVPGPLPFPLPPARPRPGAGPAAPPGGGSTLAPPAAVAAAPPSQPPSVAAPPSASPAATSAAGAHVKQQIDTHDPYAN
jgi:serine/threonine-protein kinase